MAGKCKYCGFVGTQDEIVDHAGEMCQGDCQPDTMVKNLTDNQQLKAKIAALATDLECHMYHQFTSEMYVELRSRLRQLSAV